MKRLFHSGIGIDQSAVQSAHAQAGRALRKFLWLGYLTNKTVDAKFLGHLAYYIGQCGGQGLEDLAVSPSSDKGYQRIKLLLGRDFDDPELEYTNTALHDKKHNQRVEQRVPVHLPSRILSQNFKDFKEPIEPVAPALESAKLDCARWRQHSVRQKFEGTHH